MKCKLDLLKDASAIFRTGDNRIVRTAFVWDIDPPGPDAHIRACSHPSIPRIGQLHPKVKRAIVKEIRGEPAGETGDQALVHIIYESPRINSTTGGSTSFQREWSIRNQTYVSQEMTERTASSSNSLYGVPIKVSYWASTDKDPETRIASVPRYIPQRALVAEQTSKTPVPEYIHAIAGHINALPWRGKPRRTWLFVGAEDQTEDGEVWLQRFTFWHRERTWDEYAIWRNSQGEVPNNIEMTGIATPDQGKYVQLNGITLANVMPEVDFNQYFKGLSGSTQRLTGTFPWTP